MRELILLIWPILALIFAILVILAPVFIYQIKEYTRLTRDELKTANRYIPAIHAELKAIRETLQAQTATKTKQGPPVAKAPVDPAVKRARRILAKTT